LEVLYRWTGEDTEGVSLGLGELGQRKSYRDVKHYKRRKRDQSPLCF